MVSLLQRGAEGDNIDVNVLGAQQYAARHGGGQAI